MGDLDPSVADCEARPIRKAQRKRHSVDSKLKVKPSEGAAIISNHGGHPGASRGVGGEIAEIQKRNLAFLQMPRPDFIALHDHERRQQRLREIMEELSSMTDWKKA